MNPKTLIFILAFLISISTVLAVSVATDKTDYSRGEVVTIDVTGCTAQTSVLQVFNVLPALIYVAHGDGDWQNIYNTNSDSSDGKYKLSASCEDGTTDTKYFCVNSLNCLGVAPECTADVDCQSDQICQNNVCVEAPPVEEPEPTPSPGGGGRACISDWSCGYWTFCGPDAIQTRTCVDLNYCLQAKTETKDCEPCDESWICSAWSDCFIGKQTRKCYDEHHCGTAAKKPILQKPCGTPVTGPAPAKIILVPPEQFTIPGVEIPKPSFWEKYKTWLIAIPSILILLALAIFLFFHFKTPKEETTNINELKDWVKKVLEKGASKESIKKTIRQQAHWTDRELNQAFKELEQK